MGYFDGLTEGQFKIAEDGRRLFFPRGFWGRGYVVEFRIRISAPSPADENLSSGRPRSRHRRRGAAAIQPVSCDCGRVASYRVPPRLVAFVGGAATACRGSTEVSRDIRCAGAGFWSTCPLVSGDSGTGVRRRRHRYLVDRSDEPLAGHRHNCVLRTVRSLRGLLARPSRAEDVDAALSDRSSRGGDLGRAILPKGRSTKAGRAEDRQAEDRERFIERGTAATAPGRGTSRR